VPSWYLPTMYMAVAYASTEASPKANSEMLDGAPLSELKQNRLCSKD